MGIFQILKDDLTLKIFMQKSEISYYFLFFSKNKILKKKNSQILKSLQVRNSQLWK